MDPEGARLIEALGVLKEDTTHMLTLTRRVYTQDDFNENYSSVKEKKTTKELIRENCSCSIVSIGKAFLSYFPVFRAVRTYKIREYIFGDLLAGLTCSFIHLPQAMAFGILASLRPINGLYTTFFPVLVYLLFGTSPHISFGPDSVMALLTQEVVEREANAFIAYRNALQNTTEEITAVSDDEIMNIKVTTAMACSILSGIFLTFMGVFKLGIFTSYLSVSFVGGFTTAAAIHIASSQIPKMFGITVINHSGAGKLIFMYYDLLKKITQTNWAEIVITVVSIVTLLSVKICINEKYIAKMKMPVPIDLILIIIATVISHFARLKERFNVGTVGAIPSGFTAPTLPRFQNARDFVNDAFVMAVISMAVSISMAKLLANKHGIKINDNQEIIAYGASNIVSGFFHCFPSATSPPRMMILSSLGSRTTLNAIPTALIILLVILVIGQLFVSLPMAVLAAMIIVSMKDLMFQYKNLPRIWKINKFDCIIWVVSNSVGVLADLNYAIIAGIATSIFFVIVQDQLAVGSLRSVSKTEDIVLKQTRTTHSKDISNIKIFKVPTNLYFATAGRFKSQIYSKILNPKTIHKHVHDKTETEKDSLPENMEESVALSMPKHTAKSSDRNQPVENIIIDCSVINYIDMAGLAVLQQIVIDYKHVGVSIYLTGVPERSLRKMEASGFFVLLPKTHIYFDVFDALAVLQKDKNHNEEIC